MRFQVQVQLRKHGVFQRAPQLDFTVVGKTQVKARRAALEVFEKQRSETYRALTCGLGEDGTLKMLVAKTSEVKAEEQAALARVQGMVKRSAQAGAAAVGSEGRRRQS